MGYTGSVLCLNMSLLLGRDQQETAVSCLGLREAIAGGSIVPNARPLVASLR